MDRGYFNEKEGGYAEDSGTLPTGEKPWNIDLGPQEIGSSLNPFQHQLQALNAKIKEGASKVEFEFFGQGKGNKERATPESFDKVEREEMRNLALINEVTSSTHATVGVEGLAGFNGQKGFDEQTRDQGIREVKKAIDFAAEATTGGAVVLHTGEWSRPIYDSHNNDKTNGEIFQFKGYQEEDIRAPMMAVDDRTGELIAMRKDTTLYEPKFKTVQDYEKEKGIKLQGSRDESNGETYEGSDWIGDDGSVIKRKWEFDTEKTDDMFLRIPHWNKDKRNFETESRDWNYFQKRAKEWNEDHNNGQRLTAEEIFAKTQYMNNVLQSKGSALYYAQRYERESERLEATRKAYDFYKKLDESPNLTDEEKRGLFTQKQRYNDLIPPESIKIKDYLEQEMREAENSIRHVHEASAAADVQTRKAQDSLKHVATVENYGIKKSAESVADLGIHLWKKYEANKDKLKNPLYLAPENWHPSSYGSHPDELANLIEKGRSEMVNKLKTSMGEDRAKEIANKHIKTTFDIGHLNLWKSHMERKENESDEKFDKRFSRWAMGKIEMLHKRKILGHIHLSDNFGYDDEHLTLGRGNAPIKEMVEFLKEKGYDDFIAEPGSFNAQSVLSDAWTTMGSPVYSIGSGQGQRFSQVHNMHFGYQSPPLNIVGAYSPINDDKTWSELPLE